MRPGSSQDANRPLEGDILPPEHLAERDRHVRENFWTALKRIARKLPFAQSLVAAYYCAMDPQTPLRVRVTLLGALAYFILPLDVIPDVLLGVGFTDDAAVLALAMKMVADHIQPRHQEAARQALSDEDIDLKGR